MRISKTFSSSWVLGALAVLLLSGGCARSETPAVSPDTAGPSKRVAASVAPIVDVVGVIAGNRASVDALIPPGQDSHTYEPSPGTTRQIAGADAVFVNGLNLETSLIELAERVKKPDAPLVLLGDDAITPDAYVYDFSFPREAGDPNPHVWMNPMIVKKFAKNISEVLATVYPEAASDFSSRYQAYSAELDALDAAIMSATATIPQPNRKLITYHDSFAYFAPRYGLTVIGAVQPSDFSEPSAQEVASLIMQVRDEKVPAVFGSEVFPSPVLEQIAREGGARYVDTLRDDELPGRPGTKEHSYLGMMVFDTKTIVDALGGNSSALDEFANEYLR